MDNGVENEDQGKKVAEVTKGSVTIAIFRSKNSVNVLKKPVPGMEIAGQPEYETKHYDSFIVRITREAFAKHRAEAPLKRQPSWQRKSPSA